MKQGALGTLAALLTAAGPLFAQTEPTSFFHLRTVSAPSMPDQVPRSQSPAVQPGDANQSGPKLPAPAVPQLPELPGRPSESVPVLPAPTPLPSELVPVPESAPVAGEVACPTDIWVAGRSWVSADSLIWWTSHVSLASPLVTTGTPTSLPRGTIGASTTMTLFGESDLRYDHYLGTRVKAGYWLDPGANLGIEGGGFFVKSHGIRFLDTSTLAALPPPLPLARPIIDAPTGAASAVTIVLPGTSTGSVQVRSDSRLWGTEANLVRNVITNGSLRADLIGGFRYFDLTEDLGIVQDVQGAANGNVTFIGQPIAAGTTVEAADRFYARNQFIGGQVGTRVQLHCCDCLVVSVVSMLALGPTHEVVNVAGNTKLLGTGATVPGGFLALPTNIGRQTHDEFTVNPQLGINLGCRLGQHCHFYLGYDFLYWSRVVRPGDQINPVVNVTQVPSGATFGPVIGPPQPAAVFRQTDFWAQGLHLGLEVCY